MEKIKIVALFGKSSAGKDTIKNRMLKDPRLKKKIKGIVQHTTRPKREKEIKNVDYYFVSNEDFAKKICDYTMVEASFFNDWCYGTSIEELSKDKINLGVFNVGSIKCLLDDNRFEVFPFYVRASDKTRLIRSLQREDNPDCSEICRRFFTDQKDFLDISFEYSTLDSDNENDILLFQDFLYYGFMDNM